MDHAAEERRRRRAAYEVRVIRDEGSEAVEDEDALFWDRIPLDERAAYVWALSQEVFALAHPDSPSVQPGLSRSVVSVVRG